MNPILYDGARSMGHFPFANGVFFIIFLALIALVIVLFVKNRKLKRQISTLDGVNTSANISTSANVSIPETVLKERLSKGEISEDEYDKLLLRIKA